MSINAISSHIFSFRLSGADLNGESYRDSFSQRNATNLISKAAQLVADLESIRESSTALSTNVKSFTETVEDSFKKIEYDADSGFTLPDLLRGQGIDLQS